MTAAKPTVFQLGKEVSRIVQCSSCAKPFHQMFLLNGRFDRDEVVERLKSIPPVCRTCAEASRLVGAAELEKTRVLPPPSAP